LNCGRGGKQAETVGAQEIKTGVLGFSLEERRFGGCTCHLGEILQKNERQYPREGRGGRKECNPRKTERGFQKPDRLGPIEDSVRSVSKNVETLFIWGATE